MLTGFYAVFRYGVEVRHIWGMTEVSPVGGLGGLKASVAADTLDQVTQVKMKQGRPHMMCDMRIVDDQGQVLPQDGKAVGHLQVM